MKNYNKIRKNFGICPFCNGTMEVLNYNTDGVSDYTIEECTHCYFGVVIMDKQYKKIVKALGIKDEEQTN